MIFLSVLYTIQQVINVVAFCIVFLETFLMKYENLNAYFLLRYVKIIDAYCQAVTLNIMTQGL